MGVAEYWLFDPRGEWIPEQLRGYRLVGEEYVLNPEPLSHQLGLRMEVIGTMLNFYRLSDGEKLHTLPEMAQQAAFERQRAATSRTVNATSAGIRSGTRRTLMFQA